MKINVICPSCGKASKANPEHVGKRAKCKCGFVFEIQPEPDSEVIDAELADNPSDGHSPDPSLDAEVSAQLEPPKSDPLPTPTPPTKSSTNSIMANFDTYAEYTNAQNWRAICDLNGVALDSFGAKKEIKRLPEYLEPDEVVFALTSGVMAQSETSNSFDFGANTWLVVLTSDRFLFLDAAMLTNSVDTQSIRHDRVQAVSASQGWVLGKIMVDLGSRVLTIDNCQKATVKVVADLANKWLKELSNRSNAPAVPPQAQATAEESPLDKLEKLAKLHSIGALSDDEFNAAKTKILASI